MGRKIIAGKAIEAGKKLKPKNYNCGRQKIENLKLNMELQTLT